MCVCHGGGGGGGGVRDRDRENREWGGGGIRNSQYVQYTLKQVSIMLFVVWLYLKWSSKTGLNLMTMVPLIIRDNDVPYKQNYS